jgi:hypothetical protein
MAWRIFSGGHSLRVDSNASTAQDTLSAAGDGVVVGSDWTHFQSGSSVVRVNPGTVACIVDDEDYSATFDPHEQPR